MKYKNTKTGVVIDTPCIVSGGNWIPFLKNSVLESERQIVEKPVEVQEPVKRESEENKTDFDEITRSQIMQELDAFGVEYDKRANKQTLYDLMMSQGK